MVPFGQAKTLLFRHHQWSGIFPFEGGFLPDPHYLESESARFSEPVNRILPFRDSEYVIVDVNPFFNDDTSEILLLIKSSNTVFEYSLEFPRHRNVQAVLTFPQQPPAIVFPYKGNLAVLANFFGPAKGAYIVPLPLKSGTVLQLIPASSAEFSTIAAAFASVGEELSTREQLCESRRNDFIAFYEKYSRACDERTRSATEIERDFARFWLED